MTIGPLLAAAGLLLMLRIGPDASYAADVLPAVLVFGLGLSALVAPLTATVLASAPGQHAGAASGVNNAVARTAGLLAVALLPPIAGLTGDVYRDPAAFADGFYTATAIGAVLLVLGALLAGFGLRPQDPADPGTGPEEEHCFSCPVTGPHLETVQPSRRNP
jgi:MFS family permease